MSRHCTTVVQTCHTDVAVNNASQLCQSFLQGGPQAKVLTMKKHAKAHVAAQGPHCHSSQGGSAAFGKDVTFKIGRQGDYLTSSWFRVEISSVTAASSLIQSGQFLRWTHNLGHNLIESVEHTVSGVPAATFDEFYMDFFAAFSVPAGKRNAYDNMIGNLPELVNPIYDITSAAAQVLPAAVLNIPLALPYTRDIGVSLPTGALIYNEVNVSFCLRDWDELMVVSNATNAQIGTLNANSSRRVTSSDVATPPTIKSMQLWGTYVVASSDERKRMGKTPRDMIWEIIQTSSDTSVSSVTGNTMAYLRYSHAVKALFFAFQNNSLVGERSNYTSRGALTYNVSGLTSTEFPAPNAFDPVSDASLKYEGADRLHEMPVDYFSMVQPYYYANSIPTVTGYHLFSFSHNIVSTESLGCVDFGKLTNVSMEVNLSDDAVLALSGAVIPTAKLPFVDEKGVPSALPPGYISLGLTTSVINGDATKFNAVKQTFDFRNTCLAHTVVRVIGGGLGFPIF